MTNRGIAALAYALTTVSGVICFLIRRHDAFVAFHAWQSILLGITTLIAAAALNRIPILGFGAALGFVGVAILASAFVAWRALRGGRVALPLIGDIAAEIAARSRS